MTRSYGTNPSHAHAHVGASPVSNRANEAEAEPFDRSSGKTRARALVREVPSDRSKPDTRGIVPEDEARFLSEGFGAYVRALRKQNGLSQDRASKLCGLSVSHISKLERGLRRPGVPAVKALARVLAAAGEVEAMEQRLAGLAGESLRDGADRKKLQAENRNRREALADMKKHTARIRGSIRRQEARGQVVSGTLRRVLEHGERLIAKLEATPERKPETIVGFEPARVRRPRTPRKMSGRMKLADLAAFLEGDEDDE